MSKVLNICIDDSELCTLTITDENGRSIRKTVTYTNMLDMLVSSSSTNVDRTSDIGFSEIFPGDEFISVVQTKEFYDSGSKWYVLLRQPKPVDFEFFGTIYKNVGVPKMLFAIKVFDNHIVSFRAAAVKDRFLRTDSRIFAYPFSNVSPSGFVCTGNNFKAINQAVDSENLYTILSVPEMFFAMPNSEHSYGHNKSGLYYRDLLEELSGKPFNEDYLQETTVTYDGFVKSLN